MMNLRKRYAISGIFIAAIARLLVMLWGWYYKNKQKKRFYISSLAILWVPHKIKKKRNTSQWSPSWGSALRAPSSPSTSHSKMAISQNKRRALSCCPAAPGWLRRLTWCWQSVVDGMEDRLCVLRECAQTRLSEQSALYRLMLDCWASTLHSLYCSLFHCCEQILVQSWNSSLLCMFLRRI